VGLLALRAFISPSNMPNQCECGDMFNVEGVCTSCGMVDPNYIEFDNGYHYPYDEEKTIQHGDFRSHAVSDISVMTKVNPEETVNSDMKRVLKWDKRYEWDVISTEIVNSNMKRVCYEFNLTPEFLDSCYITFKRIRSKVAFTGLRLEDVAAALVYLRLRMDGAPYSLFDFKGLDYSERRIYRYYTKFVQSFGIRDKIKTQKPLNFIIKVINSLIPDDSETYSIKRELILFINNLYMGIFAKIKPHPAVDITMHKGGGLTAIGVLLYAACKKDKAFKITQKDVCSLIGCSEVTFRVHMKRMKQYFKSFESSKLSTKYESKIN